MPFTVDEGLVNKYASGTKPLAPAEPIEIDYIKEQFIRSIEKFLDDVNHGIFISYTPSVMIPKVYGFEVVNIQSAIEYLLYHDGYHDGCISALIKSLSNPDIRK